MMKAKNQTEARQNTSYMTFLEGQRRSQRLGCSKIRLNVIQNNKSEKKRENIETPLWLCPSSIIALLPRSHRFPFVTELVDKKKFGRTPPKEQIMPEVVTLNTPWDETIVDNLRKWVGPLRWQHFWTSASVQQKQCSTIWWSSLNKEELSAEEKARRKLQKNTVINNS